MLTNTYQAEEYDWFQCVIRMYAIAIIMYTVFAMPVNKHDLISIKRLLLAARIAVQDASAMARRVGDDALARRLRGIAGMLTDELDYADRQMSGEPGLG
ncbi:MAG: hypothetical protein ACLP7P_12335 [Rhodomicrobium sp.]